MDSFGCRLVGGAVVIFECPRCSTSVDEEYFGPCDTCRIHLRATIRADARHVDLAEYEPKMNVTPNAVALKDD